MILLIRADKKTAYLGVWDGGIVAEKSWEAGRELSTQLLAEIKNIMDETNTESQKLKRIVVYKGPGSYTSLRISVSVANTIGYSEDIPAVGTTGDNWIEEGLRELSNTENFSAVSPDYGGEAHITKPRK